ncbi:MAG TPA: carboxypeptidase regulatory-like domain-containing protein [Candidatus Sulfotelmatobacter sp.]|nr:carboxypeptidase regulatory-like domain-containing protein [Candidatus Sulfotelmatobacter sp.]
MKPGEFSFILVSLRVVFTKLLSGIRTGIPQVAGLLCGAGIMLCLASPSSAQVDRAGLTGTVSDPSGRALAQTHIAAVHNDTGLRRESTSSATGTYDIPELPIGIYTVTFVHEGFKDLTFENVVQGVEHTRTLNATMPVSGEKVRIEVSTSSEQLDQTSDALGGRTERAQVEELPLNGRNWANLTALVPGAVDTGGSNQRSVRFAGRGRDDNNFTYDGIDATNIINQGQQAYVRQAIPLDTIQEFRIDSALATAEGGGTGGGQLAVTSPSGTNQFHGDAFEFIRNNVFDALVPVPANTAQQPLRLNQFGGSLGGPIAPDKTFFFLAYEGYRQHWGFPLAGTVPSDSLRAQVIAQSPVLAPIVNAYPEGQTPTSNPDIDNFVADRRQVVNEDSGMFRLDHRFSESTTAFVRANIDQAVNTQPNGNLADRQQLGSSPANAAIELLHIFSSTLVNEAKFGFNRSTAFTTNINQTGSLYAFSVSGLTTLNNNRLSTGVGNSFAGIDNATWVKGRHTLKAGVEIRRVQMNQGTESSGTIVYAATPGLTATQAFAANDVSTATLTGDLPVNGLRKTQYFGYIQDEFKLRPNFTLNLGARYSFFNIFHEVQGRSNPFDFATCGPQGFCGVGASFGQPNYFDIDPRIAIAWAPRANGGTVLRAGFGIYHEDGQLDDQNLPNSNEVSSYALASTTTPGLSYPIDPFLVDTTGIVSPRAEDRRRKDTSVTEWGLSVQQTLPADFVGTVSYVGSKGTHLLTLSAGNVLLDPITKVRQYPDFGQVSWRGNTGNSSYQALALSIKRSFSRGLLISGNYLWSHEIDDGSNGSGDGDSLVPQNVACRACERASGAWDARHVLNASAVYQLPFGPGKPYLSQPGIVSRILGSWELTSMAVVRTGFPLNILISRSSSLTPDGNTTNQRPDLVPGVSIIPPGGSTIGQWINPAAFVAPAQYMFGDTPRDYARGPGAWQVDMGIGKHIPLTERVGLEFRTEFFNIFNHPQYGLPVANISAANFGTINQTVNTTTPVSPVGTGTPREIQFSLRLAF